MEKTITLSAGDAAVTCVWLRYAAIPATEKLLHTVLKGGQDDQDARSLRGMASALSMAVLNIREGGECEAQLSDMEVDALMRLVDLCRPVWLRRERSPWFWFTFPVPTEVMRVAAAVADNGPVRRYGGLVPCEIEDAAVGNIAADRRWLERMSERQRAEAMQASWMQSVGTD